MAVPESAPVVLGRHVLPIEWFEALSAGNGSAVVSGYFWKTERSRRLLLLSTLLEQAERRPELLGPLPSGSLAWDVLAEAQAKSPTEFDAVLMNPQVGSWAAYVLRRERGHAPSALPLWADWGGIHTLALVAAAKAGLEWHTRLPLRSGDVMLPSLGLVRLPETAPVAVVQAHTEGGRIRVMTADREFVVPVEAGVDRDDWWALRSVRVVNDLSLTIQLDDVGPFRDLADPVPPARLSGTEFERWRSLLGDAWALLCKHHREHAEAIAGGVVSLTPMAPNAEGETRSASTGEAFGSVLMSPPSGAVDLAVSLVHEYQHIKLGALIHLVQLTGDDDGSLLYAPWRDDPRPLSGSLQGVYAFLGIAGFWRQQRIVASGAEALIAEFEYACARHQTGEALDQIQAATALTRAGRDLVRGLRARVTPWLAERLSPEIVELADLALDSHRVGWLLRHTRPDPGETLDLAKAWLTGGQPCEFGSTPTLRPHPQLRWSQYIPVLTRRKVIAMAGGTAAESRPASGGAASPLTMADEALVAGRNGDAHAGYLAWIAEGSAALGSRDDVRAWCGLALASAATESTGTAMLLRLRPDLVRGVYSEIASIDSAPDPLALANWLAAAFPPCQQV